MIDMILTEDEKKAYRVNAVELRLESLRNLLMLTAIVGWLWFSWASWPRSGVYELFYSEAWSISLLLLVLVFVCALVQIRYLYTASVLFVAGLVALLTGLLLTFQSPESAYLYVLPLVFSSVLLGQAALITVTVIVSGVMLTFGVLEPGLRLAALMPPLLTLILSALAVSTSTRNLHIALAWTLNSYQHAHANALLARERKTQLAQAVHSLDKAMIRLQRTNARLTQVTSEAEEARKIKQQFAQTISHELRTPLNLIAGFTETMIKSPEYYGGPLPPHYLRDLSVVYRNACHLQDLVNDVLDLARLEAAYLSLQIEALDMGALIEDAVSMARSLIVGRGLALDLEITPGLPPVLADRVRLKQVILNLLKNAARFTEQGRITVQAWAEDDAVIVAVEDTGIGIPEDRLSQIFESFRQLENPMQRRTEGAGLGLAISQQLIRLHGGEIWVESDLGTGSTFFFSLPTRGAMLHLDRSLETAASDTAIQAVAPPPKPLLLVLTHSPTSATLLTRHLPGFRIMFLSNPEQITSTAQQLLPQAMIIDTVTETLTPAYLDTVIAALSEDTVVIRCALPGEAQWRRLAVDGYLIKPVTHAALWDILRQFDARLDRMLVVDDDRDFVRLIGRMLMNPLRDFTVMYAYSGLEALQIVEHAPPDILLIDMCLPDMDGLQVIETIRSTPKYAGMRIIVIAAYEESDGANLIDGTFVVTKNAGLHPNEVLRWLQSTLEAL